MTTPGHKNDACKPKWHLLPFGAVTEIVRVLTFFADPSRYGEGNWKTVERFEKRYFSAALRHMAKYGDGERTDNESGLSHLAHAGCCILFLLWKETKND